MQTIKRLARPVSERDHIRGPRHALVTIVEYGDFEDLESGRLFPTLDQVQRFFGDDVRMAFRHYPFRNVHPNAEFAARASEAAALQGKFWEMHDWLFEHGETLSKESTLEAAESLGLDRARLERDLDAPQVVDRVAEDFRSAIRSGADETPTIFLNGERYLGDLEYNPLITHIRKELDRELIRRAI